MFALIAPIFLIALHGGKEGWTAQFPSQFSAVSGSSDGTYLAAYDPEGKHVQIWKDNNGLRLMSTVKTSGWKFGATCIAVSAAGTTFILGANSHLAPFNRRGKTYAQKEFDLKGWLVQAVGPLGEAVVTKGMKLALWSPKTGFRPLPRMKNGTLGSGFIFIEKSSMLVRSGVSNSDTQISTTDLQTGRILKEILLPRMLLRTGLYNPLLKRMVYYSEAGEVVEIGLPQLKVVNKFQVLATLAEGGGLIAKKNELVTFGRLFREKPNVTEKESLMVRIDLARGVASYLVCPVQDAARMVTLTGGLAVFGKNGSVLRAK